MNLPHPLRAVSLGLSLCGLLLAAPAHADIDSALKAYDAQQYEAAYKEFSSLAADGDNRAKSFLAMMTVRGVGTAADVHAGARLAKECAEGGEPTCYAIYAQLNLPGQGLPVNLKEARIWTRKAIDGGDARAGFLLWQAYQLDPENQYRINGTMIQARYDEIASRSVAQRSDQIEALEALAGAADADYMPARLALAGILNELSGGGTVQQVLALLGGNPELPPKYRDMLQLAHQVQTLGATRAGPKLIVDALPAARSAVAEAISRDGGANVDQCSDFKLISVGKVSTLVNAIWLPLRNPLLVGTYPLRGSWQEQWKVLFCGSEHTITAGFDADGMGGASYHFGN
ncbi:hypothetical protein FHW67_002192 [Herbaspirillum sp. Sphag1AN]|uniref:tetratricopeptide repeat protein n=1 Tax=unclassified Herbaspirillum TaxID=2624150 RepID=UPI0016124ECB|nr:MULTISPECIES: sel1 repeat family protein [unclassified Herbaspirillum]MBB3212904.1 hypothetical protein [Herbaspirillum sp. Sphag1AN]MBB3246101.1 hypothetical protein [Herbaspirillum sp. Sphag64]